MAWRWKLSEGGSEMFGFSVADWIFIGLVMGVTLLVHCPQWHE